LLRDQAEVVGTSELVCVAGMTCSFGPVIHVLADRLALGSGVRQPAG
jgi:hypothetical protein